MVEPTDAEDPATKFRVGGVAEIGAGAVAFLLADGASKAGLGEGPAPSLAATPVLAKCQFCHPQPTMSRRRSTLFWDDELERLIT
jgi:hypothetical protein